MQWMHRMQLTLDVFEWFRELSKAPRMNPVPVTAASLFTNNGSIFQNWDVYIYMRMHIYGARHSKPARLSWHATVCFD